MLIVIYTCQAVCVALHTGVVRVSACKILGSERCRASCVWKQGLYCPKDQTSPKCNSQTKPRSHQIRHLFTQYILLNSRQWCMETWRGCNIPRKHIERSRMHFAYKWVKSSGTMLHWQGEMPTSDSFEPPCQSQLWHVQHTCSTHDDWTRGHVSNPRHTHDHYLPLHYHFQPCYGHAQGQRLAEHIKSWFTSAELVNFYGSYI